MLKSWRILLVFLLIGAAFALRAPWLRRDIWNVDEGTTLTMAEQLRHGAVLYRDAVDQRGPLVPFLMAATFAVAGDWNAHAVHAVVAGLLGLSALLLWLLARRLGDERTGIAGAVIFSVLTFVLLEPYDAMSAATEWFVVFFSTVGFWLFARAQTRPGFGAGVLIGIAFGLGTLSKQPGVLYFGVTFVLVGLLAVGEPALRAARGRLLVGEITGFLATLGMTATYFAWHHALADLVRYTWTFNTRIYVPDVPLWTRLEGVRMPFVLAFANMPVALLLGVVGAGLLLRTVGRDFFRRPARVPPLPWLILGWTASGLVATMLSGRDFSHYSAQVIPGLSLACGWAVARGVELASRLRRSRRWATIGLCALLGLGAVGAARDISRRSRRLSTDDGEFKKIGLEIGRLTAPSDPIFVWGYLPELYYFSHRLPATRFVYTIFLTGMVPWSNLDMLTDTRYAVLPGVWRDFWTDFDRRPPALIVDTLSFRGWVKYPLYAQKKLWEVITRDYAAIDDSTSFPEEVRFYRRLAPLVPFSPPTAVPDDRISVSASLAPHGAHDPVLTVHAPKGTSEIVVFQGDRPYRRLVAPGTEPGEAAFFIARDDLRSGDTRFHVAVRDPQGWRASRTVDLAQFRAPPPAPVFTGPKIEFGDRELVPVEAETFDDGAGQAYDGGRRWTAHAPSQFVYRCPPTMTKLTFRYGLEETSYQPGRKGRTNGVEVAVSLETPGHGIVHLFRRELNPALVGMDQNTQTSQVEIPRHTEARLILQMLPGPMNEPAFDWSYWSDLVAQGVGPDIMFNGRPVSATSAVMYGGSLPHPLDHDRWSAQSPARFVYPYRRGMKSLTFTYGLLAIAYERPRGAGTDGIDAIVEMEFPDHHIEKLFDRYLDPAGRPADRGPQTSSVDLPAVPGGNIILRIGPGPHNNTAFDWAYIANPQAEGRDP